MNADHQLKNSAGRFWQKVRIAEPDACWTWLASLNSNGYGQFFLDCKLVSAHRVAFALENGFFAGCVGQTCGDRKCCNPAHLYMKLGRRNKFTQQQIAEIQASAEPACVLAQRYQVSRKTILRAKKHKKEIH